eukprot:CAMPEP_0196185632 /NCGR_PEP_ID=MMETSP0911-20130528/36562_1 /TAXON_ID=49265 /ORGANISM="Thalassiosira rotula, Strain GSO102" /LENGTH=43 /DNA_ID= /DNA_START= /DNA_END= /DNA_ORIENTATION=
MASIFLLVMPFIFLVSIPWLASTDRSSSASIRWRVGMEGRLLA